MVQNAEKLNNRLSEQKRSQKNILDNIKENKTKIDELKEGIDSKAVEVWALCSQLIEKENYHRLGVFNGDKYIIFSDDAKTKVLLSNLINELSDVNLADGNDHVLCNILNKEIPEAEINYIEEEFSKELIVLLDEYKEISDSNEDKIQDISRGFLR